MAINWIPTVFPKAKDTKDLIVFAKKKIEFNAWYKGLKLDHMSAKVPHATSGVGRKVIWDGMKQIEREGSKIFRNEVTHL